MQSAYPNLTELFLASSSSSSSSSSSMGPIGRGARTLASALKDIFVATTTTTIKRREEEKEEKSCKHHRHVSSSSLVLPDPDHALLASALTVGGMALLLSVQILTSRPLRARRTRTSGGRRVSMEYRKAVRGDFAFGLGLMWVSAVTCISGLAFSTNLSFVTDGLREELMACVYSFSANAGFCFLCGNFARLGVIDDREERTNLTILGVAVSTLMIVSHLFPKISEGNGKAGWFCETWSFAWCALALATNLGLNCAVEFRGGFTSWDAFYGLLSGSGAGLMYFSMASPLWFGRCFGTALFVIGFGCHVLGAGMRHSVTRNSTTAKEEGEEEEEEKEKDDDESMAGSKKMN